MTDTDRVMVDALLEFGAKLEEFEPDPNRNIWRDYLQRGLHYGRFSNSTTFELGHLEGPIDFGNQDDWPLYRHQIEELTE